MEHKAVLSTIEARMNPEVMRAVRIHIEEHVNAMKNADPDLLAMLGIQPLQPGKSQMDNLDPAEATARRETEMQQASMQPPMAPQMPGQPAMPPDMTAAQPLSVEEMQAAEMQAMLQSPVGLGPEELPNQPSLPKNALTGLPWNPQSGGL